MGHGDLTECYVTLFFEAFLINFKRALYVLHVESIPLPQVGPPQTKDSRKELSLREWLPWQNRLQETKKVGHSMKSRHLVELIQFMEVQGQSKSFPRN